MTRTRLFRVAAAAFALGAFVLLESAWAATKTWTGAGADANWSTAANWSPSGAPVAGDDLAFPNGAARLNNNNDLAANTSFNTLAFSSPSSSYALNGNAIQLVNGITATNVGVANGIFLSITLAGSQTFAITGDRVQIWNPVNLNGNALTVNTTNFVAVLELRGGITGNGGLTAAGSGFLFVSDVAGTYTGTTTVTGGLMGVSGVSLGPSVVTVTAGTLQLVNGGQVGTTTVNGGTLYLGGGGINQHGSTAGLTMNFPSILQLDMNSASDFGQLIVAGPLQLNNPQLFTNWSFTSSAGNSFLIVNPMTSAGTFNGQPEGSHFNANGRRYGITYVGGVGGHEIILTDDPLVFTAIPTLNLWSLALLAGLLLTASLFRLRRTPRRAG